MALMQPDDESRALREIAERVLGATLHVSALPEGLPLDVPVPPGGRLVGSVSYPPQTVPGMTQPIVDEWFCVILDAPDEAGELIEFFDRALAAQGWNVPEHLCALRNRMAPDQTAGAQTTGWFTATDAGGRTVAVQIQPRSGVSDVRIILRPAPRPEHQEMERLFRMPDLAPPEGGTIRGGGGSGGPSGAHRDWLIQTAREVVEVEAHLARQLETAGWERRGGGSQGSLAWSRWSIPDQPDGEGWLLVIDSAVTSRYIVHLRKDIPSGDQSDRPGAFFRVQLEPIENSEKDDAS